MQQGRFRATGMMNHHPQAMRRYSVAILVTGQVGHFWKAEPGHFWKAPKDAAEDVAEAPLQTVQARSRVDYSVKWSGNPS